jgi:hypothetical protein
LATPSITIAHTNHLQIKILKYHQVPQSPTHLLTTITPTKEAVHTVIFPIVSDFAGGLY